MWIFSTFLHYFSFLHYYTKLGKNWQLKPGIFTSQPYNYISFDITHSWGTFKEQQATVLDDHDSLASQQ